MSDTEARQPFARALSVYSTSVLWLQIGFTFLTLFPALSLVYAQTAAGEEAGIQGNSRDPVTLATQEHQENVPRWPGDVSNTDQSIAFTSEEQAWLAQAHTIRVRVIDYPPFMMIKRGGEPGGISIDYLNLIAKRTGIRIRYDFSDEPFTEALEGLINHKGPDMIITLMRTPERERDIAFSNDYFVTPNVIFARADADAIQGTGDLVGKVIAIPRDYVVQEALESVYPGLGLELFDSALEALEALASGKADAYVGNLTITSYLVLNCIQK